ncbi:hypothetical protein LPY66_10975 [Dehalobacter sp. DCM]|uniref:hypothetical protein n=1 Tax=Dehalobacter sp. DCM TaxID=2907827 RepID=UPI00308190F2|nr:hypothetical protein LPY66_10975 [Dehalobacter sp. DCM]
MKKLIYLSLLTIGLLIYTPFSLQATVDSPNPEASAIAETTVSTPDTASGAPQGGEATDAESGASVIVHTPAYTPLPYEPVKREANTGLLGGGLGLAFVCISGAVILDKRKK